MKRASILIACIGLAIVCIASACKPSTNSEPSSSDANAPSLTQSNVSSGDSSTSDSKSASQVQSSSFNIPIENKSNRIISCLTWVDDTHLAFANGWDLVLLDTANNSETILHSIYNESVFSIAANNGQIVFQTKENIYVFRQDNLSMQVYHDPGAIDGGISGDLKAAFVNPKDITIILQDIQGDNKTIIDQIGNGQLLDASPIWSPDASAFAYLVSTDPPTNESEIALHIIAKDGTPLHQLPIDKTGYDISNVPSLGFYWSADSNSISTFLSNTGTVQTFDAKNGKQLSLGHYDASGREWSPPLAISGQTAVFWFDSDETENEYIAVLYDLISGKRTDIETLHGGIEAAFSRDMQKVAIAGRENCKEILIVKLAD